MNKTKIPWADYTINPVKGLCPMACDYCYARRMYKRFKWNPEIHLMSRWGAELPYIKPSKIFVGSTMELFGSWIPDEWLEKIFLTIKLESQHTFIFLTKQPQNLIKWSPFPENCWVGVSATNHEMAFNASCNLIPIKAKVKYISFEPLLGHIVPAVLNLLLKQIQWLIIGCQTPISAKTLPKREWVTDIITAADQVQIPVFVKEPMASYLNIQRREFPG